MKKMIALLLSFVLFMQPCCTALAAIQLPSALQSIGAEAFKGVTGLEGQVELPKGVEDVGDAAFSQTDVFSMELPEAAGQIGSGILSHSGTAYVVVSNPEAVLAQDAFKDVAAVVGPEGSTAETVAGDKFFAAGTLIWKDNFAYQLQQDGTAIVAFPAKEVTGAIEIPETVDGHEVTAASPAAFAGLAEVTSIRLPFTADGLPEMPVNWPEDALIVPVIVAWLDSDVYEINVDEAMRPFDFGAYGAEELVYKQTFSSSNPGVFEAGSNGSLIPKAEGTATLTYTVECYGMTSTATAEVHVSGYALKMQPAAMTLDVGEMAMVSVVLPEDVNMTGGDYGFFSQQPDIADVNQMGLVIAKSAGTARIIYHNEYKGRHVIGETLVTVKPSQETPVTLNAYEVALYEGESFQLIADFEGEITAAGWESSNPEAVSVDEDGVITAVGYGWAEPAWETVTFHVEFEDGTEASASCLVTGKPSVVYCHGIYGYYMFEMGKSRPFYYVTSYADGYSADNVSVHFESDNEAVVAVDAQTGLMTPVSEGIANISIVYETLIDGVMTEVFRKHSVAHVATAIPAIDENVQIAFPQEQFFLLAPEAGEENGAYYEPMVEADFDLWKYYTVKITGENATGDVSVAETGEVIAKGAGEVDLVATIVPWDENDGVFTANPVARAHVTVGTPELKLSATNAAGEPIEFTYNEKNEKMVRSGDIVTAEVTGIPEGVAHEYLNWDFNEVAFEVLELSEDGRTLRLVATNGGTESHIYTDMQLNYGDWFELGEMLHVDSLGDAYPFFASVLFASVGEQICLDIDFERYGLSLASSNSEVVRVLEDTDEPMIEAVGEGVAEITGTLWENEEDVGDAEKAFTSTCFIHVRHDDWGIDHLYDINDIMYVGDRYAAEPAIYNTGFHWPEVSYDISDDEVLSVKYVEEEDGECFIPHKAGEVELTVIAAKGEGEDRVEKSLSKPILVLDRAVRFDCGSYVSLFAGEEIYINLINACGKEIESVVWNTVYSSAATITPDETGMTAVLRGGADIGHTQRTMLNAVVTFADGTTETAAAHVEVRSLEEIEFDVWFDEEYVKLNIDDDYALPYRYAGSTNPDEQRFESSDPSVAEVTAHGGLLLKKPGETTITYTARIGQAVRAAEITIAVRGWEAELSPAALNLDVGDAAYVVPTVHMGDDPVWINDQESWFESSNLAVADVNHLGLVTAVGPGRTVISYRTRVAGNPIAASAVVTVSSAEQPVEFMADGAKTDLLQLYPRQSAELTVLYNGEKVTPVSWNTSSEQLRVNSTGVATLNTRDIRSDGDGAWISCEVPVGEDETLTAYLMVEYLPTLASVDHSPNFYELSVGQKVKIPYVINKLDPDMQVKAVFSTSDKAIAAVDENGVLQAVGEGRCEVCITLQDADDGSFLSAAYAYVFVDTALPEPSPDSGFRFGHPVFYMPVPEDGEVWMHAWVEDPEELWVYHELVFSDDGSGVVEIHPDGNMRALSAGEAQITADFRGYEEYAATAKVIVGNGDISVTVDGETVDADSAIKANAGSVVRLTFADIPEELEVDEVHWNCHSREKIDVIIENKTEYVFRLKESGEFDVQVNTRVHNQFHFEDWLHFNVTSDQPNDYRFDKTAVTMSVGETVDLWPECFCTGIKDIQSNSANVVVENENDAVRFTANAVGDAVVTAQMRPADSDEYITVSCYVHVVEEAWELISLDSLPATMMIGETAPVQPHVMNTGFYWPELEVASSDAEVVKVFFDENDREWRMEAVAPGTAVISVSASKGEEVQTLRRKIIVAQPEVWFAERDVSVRPGQTRVVDLIIGTDKPVDNVQFLSEDAGLVSVADASTEEGFAMAYTCEKTNNSTRAFAIVTFEDGSMANAVCRISPMEDEMIELNTWLDNGHVELSDQVWGENGNEAEIWVQYHTNAILEENGDSLVVEWTLSEGAPVEIIGYAEEDTHNGLRIRATDAGEFDIAVDTRIYSRDGAEMAHDHDDVYVEIRQAEFEINNMPESIEIDVNEHRYLGYSVHHQHAANTDLISHYSENEQIAVIDVHGNVMGIAPGTTTVHVECWVGGTCFSASTEVEVRGASLGISTGYAKMETGTMVQLEGYVDDHGMEIGNEWWTSSNEQVALVTNDGVVYARTPGTAVIAYNIDSDTGWQAVYCVVEVEGEEPAFRLDHTEIVLFPEQEQPLHVVYEGEEALVEDSLVWTATEDMLSVDENGVVTVLDERASDAYGVVTATMQTVNGDTLTASCSVTLKARQLRIEEYQFGDGRWHGMGVDERMPIWEAFTVTNPGLQVDVEITSDDPEIVEVIYENDVPYLYARAEGHTMVSYTAAASTGESYTRSALIRVNERAMPQSIAPEYELMVAELGDGEAYLNIQSEPAYTGCDLRYVSRNPEILTFEDEFNNRMSLHGAGVAAVDVECPYDGSIHTTAQVLVVDVNDVVLRPVDDREDPYLVCNGESVQLGFFHEDGTPITEWAEGAEVAYEPHRNYDERHVMVDELNLKVIWEHFDEEIHHWVDVVFEGDQRLSFQYPFCVDNESPYFFIALEDDQTRDHYVGNVGDQVRLDVRTNLDDENFELTWENQNPEIAEYTEVEGEGKFLVLNGMGETRIAFAYTNRENAEEVYTFDFPVSVIEVETPVVELGLDNNVRVIRAGDELYVHIRYQNTNSQPPHHFFESSDQTILKPVEDQYGTFLALKEGEVTVTVTGTYGVGEEARTASASEIIHVLPAEADVELETLALDLRPGQTADVGIRILADKEVASVICESSHPDRMAAELISGEDGSFMARLTGISAEEDARLSVTVAFADGSQYTVYGWVNLVSNEEVWAEIWIEDLFLSLEGWSEFSDEDETFLNIHTNANFAEDGDRYEIEWTVEDENIVSIVDAWEDRVALKAHQVGETTLYAQLTIKDSEGNVIVELDVSNPVYVVQPTLELVPEVEGETVDFLTLYAAQDLYVYWQDQGEYFGNPEYVLLLSDDENVARFITGDRLFAVAPGRTTVRCIYAYADGTEIEGELEVEVVGAKVSLSASEITLNLDAGETAYLAPVVSVPEGWTRMDPQEERPEGYWENTNEDVVILDQENGRLIPSGTGTATVSYWANVWDENGEWSEAFAYCHVNVISEGEPFSLNESFITLYGEESVQLYPVFDEENFTLVSIEWNDPDEWMGITVDQDGVVRTESKHRVFYGPVSCRAMLEDHEGVRYVYTASCEVANEPAMLKPRDWQYGREGEYAYAHMDLNDVLLFRDICRVFVDGVEVERSFESSNEDVAAVDGNGTITSYDQPGQADITLTIRAKLDGEYTGETYVRTLHVLVDQPRDSQRIEPEYDVYLLHRHDGGRMLPLRYYPEYTGCYTKYESQNENIVAFDRGDDIGEMSNHGQTGLVEIDVYSPHDPDIRATAKVLVYDKEDFYLTAVDHDNVLKPRETVQLKLENHHGVELTENEIKIVEFHNYYGDGQFTVTKDGKLTLMSDWPTDTGMYDVWATVRTNGGRQFELCYSFQPNLWEPYVILAPEGENIDHYTLAPGYDVWLNVLSNQEWNPETIEISASDSLEVEWVDGTLHVVALAEDENAWVNVSIPEGPSGSFPIRVIIPDQISTRVSIQNGAVKSVGQEFEVYTSSADEDLERFGNYFFHSYVSSNPAIVECVEVLKEENGEDPDGRDWMTFRALSEGTAYITSTAVSGEGENAVKDVQSIMVRVLPAETPEGEPRIALLTGSAAQGAEEAAAAQRIADASNVIHDEYPDNFMAEADTTIAKLSAFGADANVKAVLVQQSVPGTVEGFNRIREARPNDNQPLLIANVPQENLADVLQVADFAMAADEAGQADTIAQTLSSWDFGEGDAFVHYSFPRHLAIDSVAQRKASLEAYCEANGIAYIEATVADPVEKDGLSNATAYIAQDVPAKAAAYGKVAFFATNCGMQTALQQAVLETANAYYPQPCCPSPYHGFPESLELEVGDDAETLSAIAHALNAKDAVGRFSTWPTSVNGAIMQVAADYAQAYIEGEITSTNDADAIEALLLNRFSGATIRTAGYDNFYTVLLAPVDFADYL